MNIQKKLAVGALALGLLGGAGLFTAPAASANNMYPEGIKCGKVTGAYGTGNAIAVWGYTDKTDWINVGSNPHVRSSVRFSPVTAGRGPSFTVTQTGNGWKDSTRLMYAYEDAKYKAVLTCTNLQTGQKTKKTYYFFT